MKKITVILITITLVCLFLTSALASPAAVGVSADQALQKLKAGNKNYVEEKFSRPDVGSKKRGELTKGQHPFAVIVSCSDSRVPPEIIFDQGLGDLFIIRTAGEVVDNAVLGSIEYAVEHLGVQLVVVLGHEDCGAVKATIAGGHAPGQIASIVEAIKPAVDKAKAVKGDVVNDAIKLNADMIVNKLKSSKPILNEFVEKGKLKIVGAIYDLDDGTVNFR